MVITAARHQAGGCTEGEGDCEMNTAVGLSGEVGKPQLGMLGDGCCP